MKDDFKSIIESIKKSFNYKNIIPLHEPVFIGNEKKYLLDTIDSTFVSSMGSYVNEIEHQMELITKTKKAIAVVNGTAALQVCLKLAGVNNNDEVITQALTFVATANAISYLNAKPIFIDVDIDTMGMSPKSLKEFLEEFGDLKEDGTYNKKTGRKISACLPMHTFGFMCRINEISSICSLWKIPLVEDAAQALGSSFNEIPSGSFGKLAAFSFNGNKIITSGGGGIITTNDFSLGIAAKHLTTTAKVKHDWEYIHDKIGYNFRMPNLNAALACAQIENLSVIKQKKKELYFEYKNNLNNKGVELVSIPKNTDWNFWLISIRLNDKNERDLFLKETNRNGIATRPIWRLLFKLQMYSGCQRDSQKNAKLLENTIVNIPSSART